MSIYEKNPAYCERVAHIAEKAMPICKGMAKLYLMFHEKTTTVFERRKNMKKTLTLVLALIMMLAVASTALAASVDFKMVITSGGSSDWSNAATKENNSTLWRVTPKTTSSSYPGVTSNWVSGETVRFRARLNDNVDPLARTEASDLYSRTNPNYGTEFSYSYFTGMATYGQTYRVYTDKPSSDPYGSCTFVGTFVP